MRESWQKKEGGVMSSLGVYQLKGSLVSDGAPATDMHRCLSPVHQVPGARYRGPVIVGGKIDHGQGRVREEGKAKVLTWQN
jgi:hypothetical protein